MDLLRPVFFLPPGFLQYLPSLGLTIAAEAMFFILLLRFALKCTWPKTLLILLLCNLLTHPLLTYVILPAAGQMRIQVLHFVLLAEFFAIVVECAVTYGLIKKRPALVCLVVTVANLFSWSLS
jgi:hypothetical protein